MYYCGIDVAKRKHAIALLDEHGQPMHRPFTIENTRAGFDQLLQALAELKGPVLIGVTHRGILIQSLSASSSTDCRQGDPPLVG